MVGARAQHGHKQYIHNILVPKIFDNEKIISYLFHLRNKVVQNVKYTSATVHSYAYFHEKVEEDAFLVEVNHPIHLWCCNSSFFSSIAAIFSKVSEPAYTSNS